MLQGEEVGKNKNVYLYEKYRGNAELEEMLFYREAYPDTHRAYVDYVVIFIRNGVELYVTSN